MKSHMTTVSSDAISKAGPPLVTMKITFGPAFSDKPLTHEQLIRKLREEAKNHSKSFLSAMMNHFADHIEAGSKAGKMLPNGVADMSPNITYYGQGSCTGCPGGDGSGSDCCLCSYNGQNVGCEFCN